MNATAIPAAKLQLAHAITAIRPDWPTASVATLLNSEALRHRAVPDIAVAAMRIAYDPETQTPARLLKSGPWWNNTQSGNNGSERPQPPPVQELRLGVNNPADPRPYIETIRRTLRHKRGQAIPAEVVDNMVGTG